MSKTKAPTQFVRIACDSCGKVTGANLSHYDVVQCFCGNYFWALQPLRDGALVAFPWAGRYAVDREERGPAKAGTPSHERIRR